VAASGAWHWLDVAQGTKGAAGASSWGGMAASSMAEISARPTSGRSAAANSTPERSIERPAAVPEFSRSTKGRNHFPTNTRAPAREALQK
jgi:hypothetical protein